jgi:hypothetical protein
MHRTIAAWLGVACALAACSPTFDRREVRTGQGGLMAMLPCKPDKGSRTVPTAGRGLLKLELAELIFSGLKFE